jgi:hypothetical protein
MEIHAVSRIASLIIAIKGCGLRGASGEGLNSLNASICACVVR